MSRRLLGYVVKLHDGTRSPRTPKPVSLANIVLPWCSGRAAEPLVVVPVFAVRRSVVVPTQITTEEQARAFNALEPKAVVEAWNAKHPIGTRVRYWPLRPTSSVLPIETRTRTAAYLMSKGVDHASVMVEGVSGSVNLSTHVDALEPKSGEPKPVPVVAGERYAVLFSTQSTGLDFSTLNDPDGPKRRIGTRDEALMEATRIFGSKVVRILNDGAHEAAVAKAREEGAEAAISYVALRMAKAAETGDVSMRSVEEFDDIVAAYRLKAEAAKGCAE